MGGMPICGWIWIGVCCGLAGVGDQEQAGTAARERVVAAFLYGAGRGRLLSRLLCEGGSSPGCVSICFPPAGLPSYLGWCSPPLELALPFGPALYLGGNWSGAVTVKVGHQLVRTGPYRWVRHPIYTGLILALLGTALERATGARADCRRPGVCGLQDEEQDRGARDDRDLRRGIC